MRTVGTYCIVYVDEMERATRFYTDVFGAEVRFASPDWTSLVVAGAQIGLHGGGRGEHHECGLGFDVDDIEAACAAARAAGGAVVREPEFKADEGGITLATIADTEGNELSLSLAR